MFDDLDQDVARLKAKWFGEGAALPRALDAEEESIAAKWLGRTEARKLATTGNGKRYRPPVVLAHYGYIPAMREARDAHFSMLLGDYWYLEVFTGSQKETVFQGEKMGCLKAVSRLQRMGISVTRVGSERAPEELAPRRSVRPARSKKFAIMDELKGYRA